MTTILSIENELSWSWGNVIHQLIAACPRYEFIRVRRGLYFCENQACGAAHLHILDRALEDYFDLMLFQNHDGIRYIHRREKAVLRIGGLYMEPNLDPTRYENDFRNVGAIIATNELLASFARPVNHHTTVIANGVDLEHFRPRACFPDRPDRPFTIGFAGNVCGKGGPYKGWRFFVQAGINLLPEGVQTKSLLHLHNQIPHDAMPEQFYHAIDALVLPSQGEGCSNVITEALACGVPVICTKTGFHGELLTHGENVWYITRDLENDSSPETTDQICNTVRRLMREPDLYQRLSHNGRAFAVAHHDVRQVAAQYDAVFRDLLARRASERTVSHGGTSQ